MYGVNCVSMQHIYYWLQFTTMQYIRYWLQFTTMQHICYWLQFTTMQHICYWLQFTTMQHICYWLQLYNNAVHLLLAAIYNNAVHLLLAAIVNNAAHLMAVIVQQYDFPERYHCQGKDSFLWRDNRVFFNNSLTLDPAFLAHRRSAWRQSLTLLSDPVDTKFSTLCLVSPRNPATHLGTLTHGRIKTNPHILSNTIVRPSQFTQEIWCDFDRASSLICGNKMPTRCNRDFYCRSYCLLNMFRASLCPSSGAQAYYTVVAACGISCCKSVKK